MMCLSPVPQAPLLHHPCRNSGAIAVRALQEWCNSGVEVIFQERSNRESGSFTKEKGI